MSAVLRAGEFLANVVNAIPNPVFVKDEQYRFVFFNDAFCTVMSRQRDQLLGRTDFDFVPPEEARVFRAQDEAAFATGLPQENEESLTDAAGGRHWILTRKSVVAIPDGKRCLVGIISDITARVAAERALQRERDRAAQYLDIAGVLILVLNADETVALINRRACEVLGVREEQAVGRNWYDTFVPLEQREQQRVDYRALIAGQRGPLRDIETTILTRQGDVRIITWHERLLRGEDGAVTGTIASGEDITDRLAAERKSNELRALIEATAQASPDAILVTDTGGRYLFWNRRFQECWSLTDQYLELRRSGLPLTPELLQPVTGQLADPAAFFKFIERFYEAGAAPAQFNDLLLKDGRVLMTYAARVSVGNPPLAAVAWIYRDISEQKKRQAELAQSQRLGAIGRLSGGVAHDFNNLLMVVGGNLELIRAWADPATQIPSLAESALTAVGRGAELTKRLLAFSRRQPLDPEITDVNALVADLVKLLPPLLGETIEVRFVPAAKLWRTVVDLSQLQTALMNLAINARDAMSTGGSLVIETADATLDETYAASVEEGVAPGDYVMIAVSDDGSGMPAEVAKRAFEPFFTTKPVGKGTGLGLSMVFGFVKQSGGHVALYSEEGHGTTVRIYLPRAAGDAASDEAAPPPAAEVRGRGAILLVEDDLEVAKVARIFLKSLGYDVLEAYTGPRALDIIKRGDPIDLLFTDVVLPDGMNGAEVARAAQALRPGLKVLFASGYSEHVLMHRGRLAEGVVLLQKPYRRQELADALRIVLDGEAPAAGQGVIGRG